MKLPAAHPIPNAEPAAALAPRPERKSINPTAAPTVPPMIDLSTKASMWFSIPGESCHVGWNDDGSDDDDDDDDDEAGGGDSGSGGATSLVGGLSVDSDAMVALGGEGRR